MRCHASPAESSLAAADKAACKAVERLEIACHPQSCRDPSPVSTCAGFSGVPGLRAHGQLFAALHMRCVQSAHVKNSAHAALVPSSLERIRAVPRCAKQPDVALSDPWCLGPAAVHVDSPGTSSVDEAVHTSRSPSRGSRWGLHPGTCSSTPAPPVVSPQHGGYCTLIRAADPIVPALRADLLRLPHP